MDSLKFSAVAVKGGVSGGKIRTLDTLRMRYSDKVRSGHACAGDVFVFGTRDDHKDTRTPDRRHDHELAEAMAQDGVTLLDRSGDLSELLDKHKFYSVEAAQGE